MDFFFRSPPAGTELLSRSPPATEHGKDLKIKIPHFSHFYIP